MIGHLALVAAVVVQDTTFHGDLLDRLPIDDSRQALHLIPGVFLRGAAVGFSGGTSLSFRGSPDGEVAVYIDGAPVRFRSFNSQGLALGTGMIDRVSVTTGVAPISLPDVSGGVIAFSVPSGGSRLKATARAVTDEPFGAGSSVGFNRLEAAAGGPVPRVPGFTWFAAANAVGQRSQYRGMGAPGQPTYVPAGLDTAVTFTDGAGSVTTVSVPRYVQWSGECEPATNYGYDCQGYRRPMDWSTALRAVGKVSFQAAGSSVSVTGLATGEQQRFFPGQVIGNPGLYEGAHLWSRLLVLNARHRVGSLRSVPIELSLNASLGSDQLAAGAIKTVPELETRDPALGIELEPLHFTGTDDFPHELNEQIIRNFRTNTGLRTPFLGRDDLRNSQPYRLNPFGMAWGWPTTGLEASLTLLTERRRDARVAAEWEGLPGNRLSAGADIGATELSYYTSDLLRQAYADAILVNPLRWGAFVGDRIDLGDVVIEAGVRYDHSNLGALFPRTPLRIFTHPRYNQLYTQAVTDDQVYAAFLADTAIWQKSVAHAAVSPRVRFSFSAAPGTAVRLGFGQHVESSSLLAALAGSNSDLSFTNTSIAVSGRDVAPGSVTTVEAGVQQSLPGGLALDVAFYSKDPVLNFAPRIRPFDDPANPGDTLNAWVLAEIVGSAATGVEAVLELGPGAVSGRVGYSLASTGDAFTRHQFSSVLMLTPPQGWRAGTWVGSVAGGVEATVIFRALNGLPYTRLENRGVGTVVPGDVPFFATAVEPLNASRLPWTKHLDLRLSKSVAAGPSAWSVYLDVRNLFGWRNAQALFAETGDVSNSRHREALLLPVYQELWNEAANNGALVGTAIQLGGDCSTWGNPVNCVALRRVEQRFGNGDGLYTQTEQERAFNTYYDSFFGSWRFFGPPRTVRIGVQVGF